MLTFTATEKIKAAYKPQEYSNSAAYRWYFNALFHFLFSGAIYNTKFKSASIFLCTCCVILSGCDVSKVKITISICKAEVGKSKILNTFIYYI
jgi:hypothetical protein